jgi:UDP-N-acetylmuramate dehydrogenase
MDLQQQLQSIVGNRLLLNEPMAKHTNFRIGGPADRFVVVQSREEAVAVLHVLVQSETPYAVLGGGSNMLVADAGFRGTVVQVALRQHEIRGETVVAEAGVLSAFLARATVDAGLSGFAWAIGLPGTIGGAIRGNAGCYGGEMKDHITSVEVLLVKDPGTGAVGVEREEWSPAQCAFAYRDSAFKHTEPAPLILSATMHLPQGDMVVGKALMQEIIAKRKEKQPLENSSAGCIFKNLTLRGDEDLSALEKDADIPQAVLDRGQIPIGWLIEQAGLKGFAIGNAQISEKHGNFCVNTGTATADQVVQLIAAVKTRIRDIYGLQIQEEIQYLGFV